ncbi:MAG TPA: hypothetical protein GX715_08670 [Armatimonadetes bacterium]|jgi:hypothetical protein|nr:hypothetical protein [Armatimonadota bacterium]
MAQAAAQARRQAEWITVAWQGISVQVPEDWYPAALGTERASGYLRIQSADGHAVEVKWFQPKHTVDLEREVAKYRKTLERGARKRRRAFEWRDKPKVPERESRPDKSRRFFAWRSEGQALGVIWYCRTCSRVILAQVVMPTDQEASVLASRILNGIEDHGEEDQERWSVYGLAVSVPTGWSLDKHQLMAGYTMLQFRRRDRVIRAERWALASVALKDVELRDFVWQKSRKFWKDFSIDVTEAARGPHTANRFGGHTRKVWLRGVAAIRRLLRRPAADWLTAQAWHCDAENKIFAVHAIHPRGDLEVFDKALDSVTCH